MKNQVKNHRSLFSLVGIFAAMLLMVACVTQAPTTAPSDSGAQPPATSTDVVEANSEPSGSANSNGGMSRDVAPAGVGFYANGAASASDHTQTGISVTGSGQASAPPDLATLSLGVEAFGGTVSEARGKAAETMDQVVRSLLANGIDEKDIQTRHFNISPRYSSREVRRCLGENNTDCFQDRESIIIGYQVTNQLSVKVRDLDSVGRVIDQVTVAGGDLTRFQGINFSIEDARALEVQAREAAAQDVIAKAQQIAELTGVSLGRPVFITEIGRSSPVPVVMAERAFAGAALDMETPIPTGELDVVITLQALFSIQ